MSSDLHMLLNLPKYQRIYCETSKSKLAFNKPKGDSWIQLAGHEQTFAPATSNTIWKRRLSDDSNEFQTYKELQTDVAKSIVPKFYQQIEYHGQYFIEIQNLLEDFHDPNIIDMKLGTRTFLESEVINESLRTDLFKKMVMIDPTAPTAQERQAKALTKLRYMQFREQQSSSASLGFRIEAVRMSGEAPNANLKKVKTREQVSHIIHKFLRNKAVRHSFLRRLKEMRAVLESSTFFMTHQLIGSSLLAIYDSTGKTGVWLIDFTKTTPIPDHIQIDHRSRWKKNSYEDGVLFGLDNIIQIWEEMDEDTAESQTNAKPT
ncbi:inositol-trisphosphate 3-kinase homolog isoform X1 [Octopus bimaculoides]|uniref:Kinase n=1 Tax=Octopus bimaculoides TaxID=37653 RepID=A0A0L8IHC9_OCTBM|nr:inositol-trisphosphate 3-kinase homolog isoform X1 [Octopus bimaculoides]|eukprot:XP_014768331.1 PREDICTED: inositol-trisphosphate 3-kinase A-like isoform X1 [Octopus bimaculoides]